MGERDDSLPISTVFKQLQKMVIFVNFEIIFFFYILFINLDNISYDFIKKNFGVI